VTGTHAERIEYDPDGNTKIRTPGANNPAAAITDPADYTYNAGGERMIKENTSDRIFHYDLDGRLIAETDGLGNLVKGYIWLHGQPFAQFDTGGAVYYYHNDHLATPQRMTDSSGTVVWAADYLPFGQADVIVDTVGNDLRFAGQYYDSETGLHYNYHRYYDPKLGRYLRADPIGLAGGINPYIYSLNNPVNLIDPWGLESKHYGYRPEYPGTPGGCAQFCRDVGEHYKIYVPRSSGPGGDCFCKPKGKKGPKANDGDCKPHGGQKHNKAIDDYIEKLRNDPEVTDIRKHQVQVDVDGYRVGNNLPDIQFNKGGVHHNIEFDTKPNAAVNHMKAIRSNDPLSATKLINVPK
jgi:RHS repeat-associated protein